jgi:hypothetical protein
MATSGSYTIGGTSPDYSTIQAWADSPTGNLTGIYEGKVRAGEYYGRADIDMAGNGYTTSASNYMKLIYDTGAFHAGDFWGGVQLHGEVSPHDSANPHILNVSTDYTRIIGMNFNRWVGASSEAVRINGADGCRIEQSLFWGAANINGDGIFFISAPTSTNKLYVSNCFFGWLGRTSIHVQGDQAGTIYVYYCDAVFMNIGNDNTDGSAGTTGYVGMGDDLSSSMTNGIDWQIKNTYVHCHESWNQAGDTHLCFGKTSTSSWTNCNNNGSSDGTAPGTSVQTSAEVVDQFENNPLEEEIGANTGSTYTVTVDCTEINSANPNTNYGSDSIESVDNSPIINSLFRFDCSGLSNDFRILGAMFALRKANAVTTNQTIGFHRLLRDWVEGQATYNIWKTSNSWATAGATGASDIEDENCEGTAGRVVTRSAGFENGGSWIANNEWFRLGGGRFVEWVQDAIDGNAPGAVGDDLEFITRWNAGATGTAFHSDDASDGSRPEMVIWRDTAASPIDMTPISTGVLDGNGVNLSSDSDYPVSVDITGATRTAYDIGAWAVGETHLATASVSGGIDAITATWIREIERTADVDLALTTATPLPALTVERTAAVGLEGQVGSTPMQNRGGDGTDLTNWYQAGSTWAVNAGAFRCTAIDAGVHTLNWLKLVPIDRLTTIVEWGMRARMISGTTPAGLYCGLREYTTNANMPHNGSVTNSSNPEFVNIFTGTETTLTADLDDTDTFCTVASTSGWDVDGITYLALQYNIENDQSDLPNTDIIWLDKTDNIVSGSNINFHEAYSGPTIPSGTKVRMSASGGTYRYAYTNASSGFDTSWQSMYNRITQPFEDIAAFSTTYAADGMNAMFGSAFPGREPPTTELAHGFRPETTHVGLTVYLYLPDATTVLEVDDLYIRTWGGSSMYSEVLHSASGTLPVAITTSAAAGLDIQRAELVTLSLDADAGEAGPIQYLRPISDITVTNFEDEGAGTTDIYTSIDEATRSDSDYIISNSGAGGTYEGGLTPSGDPESSEMHILKVVAESDGGVDQDATFSIVEGSTIIASWTVEDVPAGLVEYQFRMTQEQNDSITDYTNLRWRVVVEPSQALLTYFPGDPKGTFTRTGGAWEFVP